MTRILFPHYSRLKPARIFSITGRVIIFAVIGSFSIFNAYTFATIARPYQNTLHTVLHDPFSAQPHTNLAYAYWEKRIIPLARRELLLADAFTPSVLGVTTTQDLLAQWGEEPERLRNQYQFWQKVIGEKPDYRDAYVRLATIAFELSQTSDATRYIQKALQLDPNFRVAQDLSLVITQ